MNDTEKAISLILEHIKVFENLSLFPSREKVETHLCYIQGLIDMAQEIGAISAVFADGMAEVAETEAQQTIAKMI